MGQSQKAKILNHLKHGHSITPLVALSEYGCMRLSARIYDLKDEGHKIDGRAVFDPRTGKTFSEYYMPEFING